MSSSPAARAVRGLYAVTPDAADTGRLVEQVHAAIEGGARLVQYRNKVAAHALKLEQARALKTLCASRGVALIVNDHIDIARAVGAEGAHLGAEEGPAALGRAALGREKLLGISCYDSLDRARRAREDGADYIAFGSFFPSRVKPGAVHAPVELLREAKGEFGLPLVAIGGITLDNAPILVNAGADALAVISALFDAPDITAAARGFANLFE